MMCEKAAQIHAYHDDALRPEQRGEVEAHLASCGECRALLADLQKLSGMFASVEFAQMPPRTMNKMYGAWHAAKARQERGVRRLAGWMTAAAAAILLFVPLHAMLQTKTDQSVTAADEAVAFVPPTSPRDDANSDLVQVAQWMANDLSVDQGR